MFLIISLVRTIMYNNIKCCILLKQIKRGVL